MSCRRSGASDEPMGEVVCTCPELEGFHWGEKKTNASSAICAVTGREGSLRRVVQIINFVPGRWELGHS